MYSVKVESSFSSAHNLRGYKGKCEALHGHNWKVEAVLAAKSVNKIGMVEDFRILKTQLARILEGMDHKNLNAIPYFRKVNPTSENIAKFIFDKLESKTAKLKAVTVWESEGSSATYAR
jgi:6-pyruvoyltetrahydropterin/6-carboxytetrahydropterin synthase